MPISNPAKRLYEILVKTKKYRRLNTVIDNKLEHKNLTEMWKDIFEINTEDISEVLFSIGKLITLIKELKSYIEKLDEESKQMCLLPINTLEKALLNLDFSSSASEFADQIDDSTLQALRFSGLILGKENDFYEVDEEKLKSIRNEIDNIIEEVYESKLEEEFKEDIITKLRNLEYAIDNYRFYGVGYIKSEVDEDVGGLILNEKLRKSIANSKDEGNKSILKKVINVFTDINAIVTLVKNTIPIADEVAKFLIHN